MARDKNRERSKNTLSVAVTLIATTGSLGLAVVQLGVSQIFIAIASAFISAIAVAVLVYLQIREGNKRDIRDQPAPPDTPVKPSASGRGVRPRVRRGHIRRARRR
jgi:hypothetical protein